MQVLISLLQKIIMHSNMWITEILADLKSQISYNLDASDFTLASLFVLSGFRAKNDRWLQIDRKKYDSLKSNDLNSSQSPVTSEYLYEIINKYLPHHILKEKFSYPLSQLDSKKNLFCYMDHWRWRDTPRSVWQSLHFWKRNPENLLLYFNIPTPVEILKMQMQGKRCVSVFCHKESLDCIYEHQRDAYLFTVHDLEHAWKFFSIQESHLLQIQWAKFLHKTFFQGSRGSFINPKLQNNLDYLISDMNTHPWHAFLTLKNLFLQNFKLSLGYDSTEKITDSQYSNYENSWNQFLQDCQLAELINIAPAKIIPTFLEKLNQHNF